MCKLAPVEKLVRLVVIKEINGSQYRARLESSVRDRLAAKDKYEEEEEKALEKVVAFFQLQYFNSNSVITFHFCLSSRIYYALNSCQCMHAKANMVYLMHGDFCFIVLDSFQTKKCTIISE